MIQTLNELGQIYASQIEYKYQQSCRSNVNFVDVALKPGIFPFFNQNKLPHETLFPPLRCDI